MTKKRLATKLGLNKDTVRALLTRELDAVRGAMPAVTRISHCATFCMNC